MPTRNLRAIGISRYRSGVNPVPAAKSVRFVYGHCVSPNTIGWSLTVKAKTPTPGTRLTFGKASGVTLNR